MNRLDQVSMAFEQLDEERRGSLSYSQVQKLLISFGVRPADQKLSKYMSVGDRLDIKQVNQILEQVAPIGLVRSRLMRAFVSEDSREERAKRGFAAKDSIDGLVSMKNISEVLTHWGLTQEEIDDAIEPFKTADNLVEYQPFVAAMTDL